MSIEQAYNTMLGILPYEERQLAREIFTGSGWDPTTGTAWHRAPALNLKSTLETIDTRAIESSTAAHHINLYCDTLMIDSETTIEPTYGNELRLTIYARCVVTKLIPAFSVTMSKKSALIIYATEVPKGFSVDLELPMIEGRVRTPLGPGKKFGTAVGSDEVDVDAVHTSNISQMSNVNNFVSADWRKDNDLLRLLQFQFLVASTQIKSDRSLALKLLNFVCAASNTRSSRELNFRATSLRCSILARQGTKAALVPSVNVLESKTILQARLISAANFERAFHGFLAQEKSSSNLMVLASNALAANQNALTEYRFLEVRAKQAYADSVVALRDAQARFNEKQESLRQVAEEFQADVSNMKMEAGKEAAKEIVLKAVTCITAIVATVATAGIAAPAAGAAALDVAGKIGETADFVIKIRDVVAKIQELYEKIRPLLENIKTIVEAIERMIDILENSETPSDQPKELDHADAETDPVSGMTMWDSFTIDVRHMFDNMGGYDIPSKDKYRQSLLHLPIVAKGVLAAQVATVTAGEALTSILLRQRLGSEYQTRLEQGIDHISNDSDIFSDLKRAMFDQMLNVRNLVHLDFSRYQAAFQYYSLAKDSDASLRAPILQSIANFQSDAARMQAAISSFGASVRIQSKNFITTMPLDQKHRLTLGEDGCLNYRPDITLTQFQGYCRIRMYRVRAFLEGEACVPGTRDDAVVKLQISTSGQFLDIGFPGSDEGWLRSKTSGRPRHSIGTNDSRNYQPPSNDVAKVDSHRSSTASTTLPRAFIGEPRSVAFEYIPSNRNIVCDGYFGLQNDFTKQTPFQRLTLRTRSGSVPVKWDVVNAVRWEFLCEICAN